MADLGAGGGYFTRYLAEAVGRQGTVYAVEIDDTAGISSPMRTWRFWTFIPMDSFLVYWAMGQAKTKSDTRWKPPVTG